MGTVPTEHLTEQDVTCLQCSAAHYHILNRLFLHSTSVNDDIDESVVLTCTNHTHLPDQEAGTLNAALLMLQVTAVFDNDWQMCLRWWIKLNVYIMLIYKY